MLVVWTGKEGEEERVQLSRLLLFRCSKCGYGGGRLEGRLRIWLATGGARVRWDMCVRTCGDFASCVLALVIDIRAFFFCSSFSFFSPDHISRPRSIIVDDFFFFQPANRWSMHRLFFPHLFYFHRLAGFLNVSVQLGLGFGLTNESIGAAISHTANKISTTSITSK